MSSGNPFERWRSKAERTIDELRQSTGSVQSVVVSSEDGFQVAAISDSEATASRVAAMAGSMAALGAMASRESGLGHSKTLILECDLGLIVMVQASHREATLTLTVVSKKDAIMGQLLYACRNAARQLEDL
jgi:uncharacterized protein